MIGGVIVICIAITPILFYSYKNFPETQTWENFLFSSTTKFPDWYSYAWYLANKVIPFYLLLFWFFTCKHWWHWILLVPISMYAFQIWALINESGGYDEIELIYLFPLMMIIVPFIYLIRAKLFSKVRGNDLEAFEKELGVNRSFLHQLKDLLR